MVDACKGCYATTGNYNFPSVKAPRLHNKEDWQRDNWVADMVEELDNDRYFRWFDSGDMYHIKLAEKILEVCKATPWTRHWLPTRMHKFKKFRKVINELNKLDNVVVRLSSDGVNGEIITNGILTPKRIEALFIQALGEVLDELNNKDNKDINLNNKGGDDVK